MNMKRMFDESIELKESAMLRARKELFYEWDFEKNDEIKLDIYKLSYGSGKKAWWVCLKCGSDYDMKITSRAGKVKANCPYCLGQRVNHTNSLTSLRPSLAEEWHTGKNGTLSPDDVTLGSSKIVWWNCPDCNSEYDMAVNKRTGELSNCPYCAGKRVNETNSLASLNPTLASEWHPTLNGILTAHGVTISSGKKVWWLCLDCKSPYDAPVAARSNQTGCPYCAGQKVNHTNSLATLRSDITSEWHPTLNGGKSPDNFACGSNKKIWWLGRECGHWWEAKIASRTVKGSGCPYCSNPPRKLLRGFNDMWSTNPRLAELLLNPEDGYKYMQFSNTKVSWKCLECRTSMGKISIPHMNSRNILCKNCSDGIRFPEKFMYNLLKESNIEFKYESSREWSKDKRYDFYLPTCNTIIEVHGGQHYEDTGFSSYDRGRTLKEEQENDKLKEELADSNGIANYIIIDARHSTVEWMKNSILNSKLIELFPFAKNIDFEEIGRLASNSLIKTACNLWSSGLRNTQDIADIMKLSIDTIRTYLKRGVEIGWCDYTVSREVSIVQLTLKGELVKEWNSSLDIEDFYQTSASNITAVCRGRQRSAVGFVWVYKEDYEKNKLYEFPNSIYKKYAKSTVVQLSKEGVFIAEFLNSRSASESIGKINSSSISKCLRGILGQSYGFRWIYKEDYDALIVNQKETS